MSTPPHRRSRSKPYTRTYGPIKDLRPGGNGKIEWDPETLSFRKGISTTSIKGYTRQITDSEGHERAKNGKFYAGGPFYTIRRYYGDSPVGVSIHDKNNEAGYSGSAFYPGFPDGLSKFQDIPKPLMFASDSVLKGQGTKAISATSPANPQAQLSQGLGETLKDGLPSIPGIQLWSSKCRAAKDVGSEYLNHVFGWLPLTEEIREGARIVKRGNRHLRDAEAAHGTDYHRELEFPTETNTSETRFESIPAEYKASDTTMWDLSAGKPWATARTTTERRCWFSGSFTYAIPFQDDSWGRSVGYDSDADNVLGTNLTPDTLWKLAPWSWAIDWFSNVGAIINNTEAYLRYGQAMRYAYVMEEVTSKTYYTLDRCALIGARDQKGPSFWTVTQTKRRIPASPFGFAIDVKDLSPFQIGVAAALGISRVL